MARKRASTGKHKHIPLIWFILVIIALAIPLTILFSQQRTSLEQEAAGKKRCLQVLTPARNKAKGTCKVFSNSCLPKGWVKDNKCQTPRVSLYPTKPVQRCTQVQTLARNSETGKCQLFQNSCLPDGWVKDPSCSAVQVTPTSTGGARQYCAQVITPGRDTKTGACQLFQNSCLPDGWVRDSSCGN